MELATASLILRPWEESDAAALFYYAKDPDVGPAGGWPPHKSEDMSRQVIVEVFQKPATFAIALKENPARPIGAIGLSGGNEQLLQADERELGYWVGKPFWGQGLVPEAAAAVVAYGFTTLNLSGIWLKYYLDNAQSKRVAEKLNFSVVDTRLCLNEYLQETALEECTYLARDTWKK